MADENLSGIPPSVTLSGLNAGAPNIGGTAAPGMSGSPEASGGFLPGMEGGLDLATLAQLLQQGGEASGLSAAGPINQSLAAGSFGQQAGGLSAGSLGQSQPGYVAGQSSAGGQTQGQNAAAGAADPFSILQKFLGVAQKGVGALNNSFTASPTQSDMAGSDPAAFAAQRESERTASPTLPSGPVVEGQFPGETMGQPSSGIYQQFPGESMGELGSLYTGGGVGAGIGSTNTLGEATTPGEGFTLGTGESGNTDYLGAGTGAATGGLGLMNLLNSLQSGNASGAAGGGLQSLGGLLGILKSSPALANALGLGSEALSGVGGALGGLGGLLNLYQGIQSDNPMQIGSGALGAVQGASSLSGTLGGPTIASGLAAMAPEATASALSAITGTTVAATSEGIAAGLSAAAAAYALPVAALVQIITDTLSETERERMQNAGFVNNPIKGALYSGATAGVGRANSILDQINQSGMGSSSNEQLMQALPQALDALMPYYATAQGGRGAIRASDTLTGGHGTTSDKALPGGDVNAYTQNFTKANQGIGALVNELMKRGVSYEQLGQLPVSGDWANQSLDAGNTPQEMFARNYFNPAPGQTQSRWAEGLDLGNKMGIEGQAYDPFGAATGMLNESLGASMSAPDSATHASQLMTAMYGGPLWAALARSGAGGNQSLMDLINQHFDPWVNARTWDPVARQQHYADALNAGMPAPSNYSNV